LLKSRPGSKKHLATTLRFIALSGLVLCSGLARADIYRSLDPETPTKYTNMLPTEGRWELYLKERPAPIQQAPANGNHRFAVDSHSRYASQIQAAAIASDVDAALIRAVISVESGYNASAVSSAGAVGLMQLMPETAKRYKVADRRNPEQNIHGGAQYLRDLLRLYNNNLHLTLAAYNAGEQAVMKYGNRIPPFRETLAYVPKVMKFYKQYSSGDAQAVGSGSAHSSATTTMQGRRTRVSRTYLVNPPA